MMTVWAVLAILGMALSLALHILGLPANWVLLAIAAGYKLVFPATPVGWSFFGLLAAIAAAGELIELAAQFWGCKRFGGTTRGNWGAFLGAVIGAITGAPFLFGLGALIGALAGGFLGSLLVELAQGRPRPEALRAACGAFWGRVFGLAVKVSLGIVMLFLTVPRIWPE
jgi:uncharacterized protein YqgC (DUF456 family)